MDRRIQSGCILLLLLVLLYISTVCKDKCKDKSVDKLADIKQKIYKDILLRTKRAFNKLDIPFFLSSGTCLGYFREGQFIEYDYDIDVGVFDEDYTPDIITEMENEGLVMYRVLGERSTGMELSFRLPGTELGKYAKIDVFLHYRSPDKQKISWYSYKKDKKIHYRVNSFSLEKVKFVGVDVHVPHPTIDYIKNHYGKDWMVPKKPFTEYRYHSSPVSIVSK